MNTTPDSPVGGRRRSRSSERVGEMLVTDGAITQQVRDDALATSLATGKRLGQVLVQSGALTEDKLAMLLVGFADPDDISALDDVERVLKRQVTPATCPESQILAALDRFYRRTDEISGHAIALGKDLGDVFDTGSLAADGKEEAPVIRLLQSLLEDAVQVRASDVHIEPQERTLQIRFRIGGVLQPQAEADVRIASALTQRLNADG